MHLDPSSTSSSEPLLLRNLDPFPIIKYFTQVALFMHLQQAGLTAFQ